MSALSVCLQNKLAGGISINSLCNAFALILGAKLCLCASPSLRRARRRIVHKLSHRL